MTSEIKESDILKLIKKLREVSRDLCVFQINSDSKEFNDVFSSTEELVDKAIDKLSRDVMWKI